MLPEGALSPINCPRFLHADRPGLEPRNTPFRPLPPRLSGLFFRSFLRPDRRAEVPPKPRRGAVNLLDNRRLSLYIVRLKTENC
jgi:hypothetical protein